MTDTAQNHLPDPKTDSDTCEPVARTSIRHVFELTQTMMAELQSWLPGDRLDFQVESFDGQQRASVINLDAQARQQAQDEAASDERLFEIHAVQAFNMFYAVRARDAQQATQSLMSKLNDGNCEYHQEALPERIIATHEITMDEFHRRCQQRGVVSGSGYILQADS